MQVIGSPLEACTIIVGVAPIPNMKELAPTA